MNFVLCEKKKNFVEKELLKLKAISNFPISFESEYKEAYLFFDFFAEF